MGSQCRVDISAGPALLMSGTAVPRAIDACQRSSQMQRVVLVTGASQGVGAATARALAQDGWTVGLMARSTQRLEAVAQEVVAAGGRAVVCTADVSNAAAVEQAVEHLIERAGPVSALVNNAGMVDPIGHIEALTPDDFERTIAVNLHGAFHAIKACLPSMRHAGDGTIVQVSSGAAHRPLQGWTSYCVSKAGLWMLTQALHLELADEVHTYGFQPGTVDTQMQAVIRRSRVNPVSRMTRDQHLHPTVPAGCIAWLLRTRPPDLVGQDLRIDSIRARAGQ